MKIILKRTIPNSQCRVESVECRENHPEASLNPKPNTLNQRSPNPYTLNPTPAYDGTLTINGQYVCDTVENALTALPPGEYRIVRHYCKQYDRKMPLVVTAMSHEQRANQCRDNQCRVESVESRENLSEPKEDAKVNGNPYTLNPTPYTKKIPNPYTLTDDKPRAEPSSLEPCRDAKEGKKQSCLNSKPACNRCKRKQHVGINTTMPLLCPMLKPGNGVHGRTDGSIILGTRIVPGCLKHSLQAFGPLAERIRKAIGRGKEVTLVIKD